MVDRAKLVELSELGRASEGGGRSWAQEDMDLYDEVSKEQYKRIVKGRLAKDDFVMDGGVIGYNDSGMDEGDGGDEAADSDQDDYRSTKCASFRYPPLTLVHPDEEPTTQSPTSEEEEVCEG
jgi:DNA polymerase alpha subunit A